MCELGVRTPSPMQQTGHVQGADAGVCSVPKEQAEVFVPAGEMVCKWLAGQEHPWCDLGVQEGPDEALPWRPIHCCTF